MFGFSVELSSETASFRDPGGQLYHATLPLPPVSTIIGIAGAAMGVPFQQAWELFKENDIHVGVKDISVSKRGASSGRGLDLWKYQKIVSNEVRSDVLKREFLFRPSYLLCYGGQDKGVIEQIRLSFQSPAWALSLGTSDDIASFKTPTGVESVREVNGGSVELSCCLIPGDQSGNYSFDWEVIRKTHMPKLMELPLVKHLPVAFVFGSYGERKAFAYRPFTFLSGIQRLNQPLPAFFFGQEAIPLISITQG